MGNGSAISAFSTHVPDRLFDDRLLEFDLPEIIEKIKAEDGWKMGRRNALTLMKSSHMM